MVAVKKTVKRITVAFDEYHQELIEKARNDLYLSTTQLLALSLEYLLLDIPEDAGTFERERILKERIRRAIDSRPREHAHDGVLIV